MYEIAENVIQMSTHGLDDVSTPVYGYPDSFDAKDARLRACRAVCRLWNQW